MGGKQQQMTREQEKSSHRPFSKIRGRERKTRRARDRPSALFLILRRTSSQPRAGSELGSVLARVVARTSGRALVGERKLYLGSSRVALARRSAQAMVVNGHLFHLVNEEAADHVSEGVSGIECWVI